MGALAEQLRVHDEARSRLWSGQPPQIARPVVSPRVSPFVREIREQRRAELARLRALLKDQRHWSAIVREVARKHAVSVKELMSRSRRVPVVVARHEAMWRMRTEITVVGRPMSLEQIAERFNRHHTTALYAVRKHQGAL